jgi:hypothetical protein
VVINAKLEAWCPPGQSRCRVALPHAFAGGGQDALSVAVYVQASTSLRPLHRSPPARLLGVVEGAHLANNAPDAAKTTSGNESDTLPGLATVNAVPIVGRPRVLVYSTVENTPQAQSAQAMVASHKPVVTVEALVMGTAGNATCSSLGGNCGMYHATPAVSSGITGSPFYCWWRQRPGSAPGSCPWLPHPCADCPDIPANALWLANLMHRTGVDVVVPDTTNLRHWDEEGADELNMRPVEVLAEEFIALRAANVTTPSLAVWSVAAKNTSMYVWPSMHFENSAFSGSLF